MADGDLVDPTDYGSIVRNNLMKRPFYAPYCMCCSGFNRMKWDGEQFACLITRERTEFPAAFIEGYKARWHAPVQASAGQADAVKGDI
ncbi:hypothetical protein [Pararhodobacter sp.]|uniref:hypothetical protein n=1 Tax=Pararhodobacter sp. TaxID=2127056 RepID=UPI002FDDEF78